MFDEKPVRISTTWSKPVLEPNRRSLSLYLNFLLLLERVGKILIAAFVLMFAGVAMVLLFGGELEQIAFDDGTGLVCLYNTNTGQVEAVNTAISRK